MRPCGTSRSPFPREMLREPDFSAGIPRVDAWLFLPRHRDVEQRDIRVHVGKDSTIKHVMSGINPRDPRVAEHPRDVHPCELADQRSETNAGGGAVVPGPSERCTMTLSAQRP